MALNARQQKFAALLATGTLSHTQAAKQAGYSARSAGDQAYKLAAKPEIASLSQSIARQADAKAKTPILSRTELAELLGRIIKAGFSKPELAKPYEALKAAELLAKLQGYNEPEAIQHSHMHVHVDAALIEELRSGYASLGQGKGIEGAIGGPTTQSEATSPNTKGGACPPSPPALENIHTTAE